MISSSTCCEGTGRMSSREIKTPWYITAFGDVYPLLYAHRDDAGAATEICKLQRLIGIRDRAVRVLDVGCGTGRHSVILADSGHFVVGLDYSPVLLKQARDRGRLSGRLIRGDMRYIPLRRSFDLVLSMFTSFGYFEDDEENWITLRGMCRVVRPGGFLVMDHINRVFLERNLVDSDTGRGKGCTVTQNRRIRGNRIEKDIIVSWDHGDVTEISESVRLFEPEELFSQLQRWHMGRFRVYGDLDGSPYTQYSHRMIIVAVKRDP